jgi:hypothetical protein
MSHLEYQTPFHHPPPFAAQQQQQQHQQQQYQQYQQQHNQQGYGAPSTQFNSPVASLSSATATQSQQQPVSSVTSSAQAFSPAPSYPGYSRPPHFHDGNFSPFTTGKWLNRLSLLLHASTPLLFASDTCRGVPQLSRSSPHAPALYFLLTPDMQASRAHTLRRPLPSP